MPRSLVLAARGAREPGKHREKRRPSQPGPRIPGDPVAFSPVPRRAVGDHPDLCRPVLFVNPTHTHGFEDIAADEAVRLIEELRDHSTQERFVYYHAWRLGDVVMWDEIATMHRAPATRGPRND